VCTLLIYRRPLPGVELAVAANRDELYSRPAGTFGLIQSDPLIIGGMDPEAGGTWLAVNGAGFVVAVTNARLGARRGAEQRSRGLLALDLVRSRSFDEASKSLYAEDLRRYAPANFVVASGDEIIVATNLPEVRVGRVEEPDLGVGNTPAFSGGGRIADVLDMGRSPDARMTPERFAGHLQRLLARHDPPTACHHLEDGGTVSSTMILVTTPLERALVLHADGPPCRTPWRRVPTAA